MSVLIAIGQFFTGIWNWFWNVATFKLKLVILGCIAGLCILGYILWQNHKIDVLRQENVNSNLNRGLVNVDILSNQINALEKEGNVLQNNTNQVDTNRNAVDRRDSNSFTTTDNKNRFCRRNCDDSLCIDWRKEHPNCQ